MRKVMSHYEVTRAMHSRALGHTHTKLLLSNRFASNDMSDDVFFCLHSFHSLLNVKSIPRSILIHLRNASNVTSMQYRLT